MTWIEAFLLSVTMMVSIIVLLLFGALDFFDFVDENKYINEENFFPDGHKVLVRPSDKKALFNRVMESPVLYDLFQKFLFARQYNREFIDSEIDFVVETKACLVGELNGTTGSGKSQLSRQIVKRIARRRRCNVRFIINGDLYESSKGKQGYIFVILDKAFKGVLNCYITYSFFETTRMIKKLSAKDMIIQDEVDKSMGTDSELVKRMINNIININIRKNMVSIIFNTPLFVAIKNLNFVIETFAIRNNGKEPLTRDNMVTFAMMYDKNCKPFAISSFSVWESKKEHEFYETESLKRKNAFKTTGGGSTVNPDRAIVDICAGILLEQLMKERPTKQGTAKSIARYTPGLEGQASGMLVDIVAFAWETYSQIMAAEKAEKKKKEKEAKEDTDQDVIGEMAWDRSTAEEREEMEIEQSIIAESKIVNGSVSSEAATPPAMKNGKSVLEFVSDCVKRDFGDYYQNLWDWIVGAGMTYDQVSEKLKSDTSLMKDVNGNSHQTVGNEFKKVREGSKKEGKATGVGYYTELWWALKHNSDKWNYLPPGNDNKPDYIHEDGTVDSIKSVYEVRNTYYTPCDDCKPEYEYCLEHNLPSFRLIFINYKQTRDKFLIKIIDMKEVDKRVTFRPNMFK